MPVTVSAHLHVRELWHLVIAQAVCPALLQVAGEATVGTEDAANLARPLVAFGEGRRHGRADSELGLAAD